MNLRDTKIDCSNADGSVNQEMNKAFQEMCFKQGFEWYINNKHYSNCDCSYLSAWNDGQLAFFSGGKLSFERSTKKQVYLTKVSNKWQVSDKENKMKQGLTFKEGDYIVYSEFSNKKRIDMQTNLKTFSKTSFVDESCGADAAVFDDGDWMSCNVEDDECKNKLSQSYFFQDECMCDDDSEISFNIKLSELPSKLELLQELSGIDSDIEQLVNRKDELIKLLK